MKPAAAMTARKLGKFLTRDFRRIFGSARDDIAERLGSLAQSTIECLVKSDALLPQLRTHAVRDASRS